MLADNQNEEGDVNDLDDDGNDDHDDDDDGDNKHGYNEEDNGKEVDAVKNAFLPCEPRSVPVSWSEFGCAEGSVDRDSA